MPWAVSNYTDIESHSQPYIKGTEQERKSQLQWRFSSCILSGKLYTQNSPLALRFIGRLVNKNQLKPKVLCLLGHCEYVYQVCWCLMSWWFSLEALEGHGVTLRIGKILHSELKALFFLSHLLSLYNPVHPSSFVHLSINPHIPSFIIMHFALLSHQPFIHLSPHPYISGQRI